MNKTNRKKRDNKRLAQFSIAILVIGISWIAFSNIYHMLSEKKRAVKALKQIKWNEHSLPAMNSDDMVGITLQELDHVFDILTTTMRDDTNLMRMISRYMTSAMTWNRLDADLKRMRGMSIAFIGQFHESLNSNNYPIEEIQKNIADAIRHNFDVVWTEDFCGGSIITPENAWKQLVEESSESDIPALRLFNNEKETREYMRNNTAKHASFQLLFSSDFQGEIRGVDYNPLKAIQQHLMEYDLPSEITGRHQSPLTKTDRLLISKALSDARDIYILDTIAINADRDKRNVLVLGAYHSEHIARIMANYGVKCVQRIPE